MIATANRYGPWASDLDPAERRARLRSMQAITRLCCGARGQVLADWLRRAETDEAALEPALDALDHLAPLDRRRILASFAAVVAGAPAVQQGGGSVG